MDKEELYSPWEVAARHFQPRASKEIERDWRTWVRTLFPSWFYAPFAPHHEQFWEHVWSVRPGHYLPPFVAIWPRGHAKSTAAEGAVVALAAMRLRSYALWVSATQDLADDHVRNIGTLLEEEQVSVHYPQLGDRAVGKYGHSRAWRRERLWSASGFVVDALGLDTAARGLKLGAHRPDVLVLDEIDTEFDTPAATQRKLKSISRKILPALADNAVVLAVQNLPNQGGLFGQLASLPGAPTIDILQDRVLSGPIPAANNLEYKQDREGKWVILHAEPTWEGEDVEALQRSMDKMGLTAFLAEKQHHDEPPGGGMYDHLDWQRVAFGELPPLVKVEVWVDPAVSNTDHSDAHAIQCDGLGTDGKVYRLFSWESRATPRQALKVAIRVAVEHNAPGVGIETDQGGETWQDSWSAAQRESAQECEDPTERTAILALRYKWDKASKQHGQPSKMGRSARMLASYERGEVVHVIGTHDVLERALRRFPKTKPFDLVDAAFWSWSHLMEHSEPVVRTPPLNRQITRGMPGRLSKAPGRVGV